MATKKKKLEDFSDEEAQRRFETLLHSALNTPPAPMKDRPKKRAKSKARKPKPSS